MADEVLCKMNPKLQKLHSVMDSQFPQLHKLHYIFLTPQFILYVEKNIVSKLSIFFSAN